ncbi:MAG: hypothetical protein WA231_20860, partial [Methylocella sp.]
FEAIPREPRFPCVGSVDAMGVEARAAEFAKRSVKRGSKRFAFKLAVRRIDLTTLEEADTPSKAAALSSKACIS